MAASTSNSEQQTAANAMEPELNACESDEGLNKLFQRMKSDTMYELRNIQHSHRPVTGQEHRQNLHQFMKKHLTDSEQPKGNVPANVDNVEEHRPQSVVVEVQGIVEQRPVSSILQSAAFRHRLENIIRGSIQSTRQQSPSQSRASTPSVRSRASSQIPRRDESSNGQQREVLPVPRLERRDSTDSISSVDSFSSAMSSVDQDLTDLASIEEDNVPSQVPSQPEASYVENPVRRSPTPIPTPRRSQLLLPPRVSTPPREPQPINNHDNDETDAGISWGDISRVHREELVQELSDLLHTRLVSSTLEGEFRATLEVMFQDHVDTNGPAVQQFVQSLPGRGVPHNDFSHLGIDPMFDLDNSDNISIASVSAHSVPYTQTNTFLGKEIQGLKTQMKSMMSMLKMTQELQLDIQRSIRQEVAAALSQASVGASPTTSTGAPAGRQQPVRDSHCLICLDRHTDSVLYQCGHMCVCYMCGKDLMTRRHCCPVCRAPIKDVIRAYKTNAD